MTLPSFIASAAMPGMCPAVATSASAAERVLAWSCTGHGDTRNPDTPAPSMPSSSFQTPEADVARTTARPLSSDISSVEVSLPTVLQSPGIAATGTFCWNAGVSIAWRRGQSFSESASTTRCNGAASPRTQSSETSTFMSRPLVARGTSSARSRQSKDGVCRDSWVRARSCSTVSR